MKKKDILFTFNRKYLSFLVITYLMLFFCSSSDAQNNILKDFFHSERLKMTSSAFGGTGVLCTQVNNQFTVMTGGRGSATFNNRYTFGGGGWGMPNGVELKSGKTDNYEFVKMGYGGLEFGYIISHGNKMKIGTNLLVACGIVFKETVPKSSSEDFNMFPILKPSVYSQITLEPTFLIDIGLTYRYISGANLSYISDHKLSGFSCYVAFLIGKCN